MSYTKITTSFKDHETVLTAAHLQHMENGIADNDAALVNRVRTDTNAQGLGTSQKRNARANIDVPSTAEMTSAVAAEADLRSAADSAMETKTDGIQNEVDQAKGNITDLQSISSSLVGLKTVSGNPVVVHDALAGKIHKLVIPLGPKQDLHGYEKPWIGGAGKNLLPPLESGGTVFNVALSNGEDGSIIASGTASKSGGRANSYAKTKPFVLKAGTYITSNESTSSTKVQVVVQTADGTAISGGTNTPFTVTEDTEVTVGYNLAEGNIYDGKPQYIQLEAGSTTTRFEPYSNICPIVGYDAFKIVSTGKNWLNMVMTAREANGIRFEPQANGLVKLSGTSTAFASRNSELFSLPVGKYTVVSEYRVNGESIGYDATCDVVIREEGASTNLVANFGSFEVSNPNQQYFLRIGLSTGKTVPANYEAGAMICKADDVASSYEPFGHSLSISLTSATGSTVYGGTLTLNEDGSGTVVVDRVCLAVNDICSRMSVPFTYDSNMNWFYQSRDVFPVAIRPALSKNNDTIADGLKSSALEPKSRTGLANDLTKNGVSINLGGTMQIRDGSTALNDMKDHIGNETICYPLDTPQTYILSVSQLNTLLGTSRIWSDTDTPLTLTYKTDKYGKISEVYSAFPEETAGPADIVTVTDGANDISVKELTIAVEPQQDLHGYDRPWVGGAGKNLLHSTIEQLKSVNTSGSWSDLVYTCNGIVFTVNTNDGNSIDSIIINGTATADTYFRLDSVRSDLPSDTLIADGTPTGSTITTCAFADVYSGRFNSANAEERSFTADGRKIEAAIKVTNGYTANNLVFKPMIRLATETDATYAPYSNICPISGWDEATVTRTGKNLFFKAMSGYFPADTGIVTASNLWQIDIAHVYEGKTYTFAPDSVMPNGGVWAFYEEKPQPGSGSYNGSRSVESGKKSFTAPITGYVAVRRSNGETGAMLVEGETISSFEPYNPDTISISLSIITGSTVYGGTVRIKEDGTGEVVVDRVAEILNGSESYTRVGSDGAISFRYMLSNRSQYPSDKFISTHFARSKQASYTNIPNGYFMVNSTGEYAAFRHPSIADESVANFQAWVNAQYNNRTPFAIAYELATPVTYPFTAPQLRTLLGHNTVWSDAGKTSIVYRADTGLLINKLISALNAYGITV